MSEMILHDDRDTIIAGLREQLRQAREELAAERSKGSGVEEGVAQLRAALLPLKDGLDRIFGILPASELPSVASPRKSAAWESWKSKLGGKAAEAIDVLMLHGEMNAVQLRLHLQCGKDYVYNVISQLHKAQLINKNGGKISLKEL